MGISPNFICISISFRIFFPLKICFQIGFKKIATQFQNAIIFNKNNKIIAFLIKDVKQKKHLKRIKKQNLPYFKICDNILINMLKGVCT